MAHGMGDLMSLLGDLIDFWRSAHEAITERRRKRAQARAERREARETTARR